MGLFDVIAEVVGALDLVGIPHMVSGSVASARYGEARSTQDVDMVIEPTSDQLVALGRVLSERGWYVGDGVAALERRSQFNVIDPSSGWKVDLIIRKARPYSIAEFERRVPVTLGGVHVSIVTPEDSILSKLEWSSLGGSERQFDDVRSVIVHQRGALDWEYLRRWADELGVSQLLDEVAGDSD